jgi:Na+/phosphate symporter
MISKRATLEQKEWVKPYFSILSSLDLIGYNLDGLFDRIQKMLQEKILFTDRGLNEINQIFQETVQLLENMPDFLLTGNRLLAQQLQEKGKRIFRLADEFGEEHESRLIEGLCMPKASPIYLGLLESLKGIAFHSLEITEKMVSSSAKA